MLKLSVAVMQKTRRQSSKKIEYLVDYRKDYLRIKVRWSLNQLHWRSIDLCGVIADTLRQAGYRYSDAQLPHQFDRETGTFAKNKGFVYAGNGEESCIMAWQCDDRDKFVNLDIALRQRSI